MAREYEEYLREKVSAARRSKRARQGFTNDEVEAYFAAQLART